MASKLFLILGHGHENVIPYESRNTLPAGTYIVTLSECGIITQMWQLYNTMRAFMDKSNEDVLRDPISNKELINDLLNKPLAGGRLGNTQIRIYGPGENYPDIYTDLYAFFKSERSTAKSAASPATAAKSGVYTFPLDPETFLLQPEQPENSIARVAGDPKKLEVIYSGSIFPPQKMQGDSQLRFPIKELIEKFGPGVYYYPICRAPIVSPELFDIRAFKEFLKEFTIEEGAATNEAIDKAETPQQMYDVYMGLPEKTRKVFEKSYTGTEYVVSLRNKLTLPDIRAKSAQRQRTRGGKRKTRGRNRTLRRKHFQRSRK